MTDFEKQFLFLIRSEINNEKLPDGYRFDVSRVFSLAALHNLTPIVYNSSKDSSEDISRFKNIVVKTVAHQMMKNTAFRDLYNDLMGQGIRVVVLKGPVCASFYNNPDCRLSSDFDIVVSEYDRDKLRHFLLEQGFCEKNDSYINKDTGLYLEVATQLGEGTENIKNSADEAFCNYEDRLVTMAGYQTLGYTDNFVYLLYHAFKHFIGSGFGIRQLVDIVLFTRCYEEMIDFESAKKMLSHIGVLSFACNIFYAAEKLFDFSLKPLNYKAYEEILCYDDFVADLLSAGVFGKSSEDRLHSASLVTSAVSEKGHQSFIKTVFPPYCIMKRKFPILSYLPFFLPFFWILRLFTYCVNVVDKNKKVSPSKSIQIAKSRIELMKKMGIIKQQTD